LKAFFDDIEVRHVESVVEASTNRTLPQVSDTSEKGLESLIFEEMLDRGWLAAAPGDYNREYAIDLVQLRIFLMATQKSAAEALDLDNDSPTRRDFLARLQGQITSRGVIDVLRN